MLADRSGNEMPPKRSSLKRSTYNLKRLLEDVVRTEWSLDVRPLRFFVDAVETRGRPISQIRVWATLHFLPSGSPFCCGEPGCHLLLSEERLACVEDEMRKRLGLRQNVSVDFADRIGVRYHDGVVFNTLNR